MPSTPSSITGKAFSWNDLPRVMKKWKTISGDKPFLLKGIQSVADAKKAVELGVDGLPCKVGLIRQLSGTVG
jgi:isopentenyl diphosphate isomerase/L-lactate dehydrogenase-like FMN-dependent dehydrogenase